MALKPGTNEEHVDDGMARESAVAEAWDKVAEDMPDDGDEGPREGAADNDDTSDEGAANGDAEVESEGPPRDEHGRFAKKEGDEEEQEGAEGGEAAGAAAGADAAAGDPQAAADAAAAAAAAAAAGEQPALKGPQSWRPGERDALMKLKGPEGEAVRAAAIRREAQFEGYQRETEQIRRFANEFVSRAEPYRPLFAMLNTTPLQAFDVLMRSAAVLYQGDSRMKAKVVAEMIRERGIDPSLIADFLDGKTPDGQPVAPPDPHIQQLTQTVQQLAQRIDSHSQTVEQQQQELADRHVAEWSKDKPWYHDVKTRMARLIQADDSLTLDQAYATAITLDPEIRRLEAQRVKAAQVKEKAKKADADRRAASSPKGSPTVRARGTSSGDRETDVANAWEEAEGRA